MVCGHLVLGHLGNNNFLLINPSVESKDKVIIEIIRISLNPSVICMSIIELLINCFINDLVSLESYEW
jgi:hypothetical protein